MMQLNESQLIPDKRIKLSKISSDLPIVSRDAVDRTICFFPYLTRSTHHYRVDPITFKI